MPNLVSGIFKVQPLLVTADVTLSQLATLMEQSPPHLESFTPGWGGPDDSLHFLGRTATEPAVTKPVVVRGFRDYPDALLSRLYWYESDPRAKYYVDGDLTLEQRRALHACDVLIASDGLGGWTVLVTTRTKATLNRFVLPALRSIFSSADGTSLLQADTSRLALGNADFFLWLVYRSMGDPSLSEHVRVERVHQVNTQTAGTLHGAVFRYGIDPDRHDVNATLASKRAVLGPAKLLLRDDELGLTVDFELFEDGGFGIKTSETSYDDEALDADLRLNAVLDLAFHVTPTLRNFYESEEDWMAVKRDAFRAARWQRLIDGQQAELAD
jgi:hypothetical protein